MYAVGRVVVMCPGAVGSGKWEMRKCEEVMGEMIGDRSAFGYLVSSSLICTYLLKSL